MAKEQYYRLDRLDQLEDIQYYLLIGQRANGKSYAVKERALERAWKKKERFVYMRRYSLDIKQNAVESYFEDAPVKKITGGEWDRVKAYHGFLYWCRWDEDEQKDITSKEEIGRYVSLSEDARIKSQVFPNTTMILYEELIPIDNMYLENETTRLQNMVSSIFRRNKGVVYLVGNTLSRVSPYAKEWEIDFTKLKIGEIRVYNYHVGETVVRVAVEYCESTNYKNTMFFGRASKQILSGEWEVQDRPKLERPLKEYEVLYKMLVEYQNFKFILLLLCEPQTGGKICYVYPSTTEYHGERILTDRFSENPFISSRLDMKKRPEQDISTCFALNKLCFSDNLTGSDFSAINEHFHIAKLFE